MLFSSIGGQGREWNHHEVLEKGSTEGLALPPFSEGRLAVSSKPSSPCMVTPAPACITQTNLPYKLLFTGGQESQPSQAPSLKLSSSRQLSVLKEYTDLTFLRSHRRLISI